MPEGSHPEYEIELAHFITSDDVERSRRFYTEVLGGKTIRPGEPTYVALANSWIIINGGGGPTDDLRDPDGYLIEVGETTLPGGWRQFLTP
jgi:hypothetical protein